VKKCEIHLSNGVCPSEATHGRRCREHREPLRHRVWSWAIGWRDLPRWQRPVALAWRWLGKPLTRRARYVAGRSGGLCGYPKCDNLSAWGGRCNAGHAEVVS
jgi:hypothetical protein